MQNGLRHIFLTGLCIGCTSMLYFLLLVLHMPFWVIIPVILLGIGGLIIWFRNNVTTVETGSEKLLPASLLILAGGLVLLGSTVFTSTQRHGGWDAWAMWNYHARFMADGEHWRTLFESVSADHPDYPLMLSSFLGFIIRLFSGNFYHTIPLVFSVLITVCTTVLLFAALAKRNIIAATTMLYFMATDKFFVQNAVSQYADTPLAFFLLCALAAAGYAKEDSRYITLTTAFLGCCAWTKNEGIILTIVFVLFNQAMFFRKDTLRYIIAGGLLPVAVWMILKLVYAPANDMVGSLDKTYAQVFAADRYRLIYTFFIKNLDEKFYWVKMLFYVYLFTCAFQKKLPSRHFFMLLACLACYLFTYVFSPLGLEWHLATSQDRLMLQLMPAFVFVMAGDIARCRWLVSAQTFVLQYINSKG